MLNIKLNQKKHCNQKNIKAKYVWAYCIMQVESKRFITQIKTHLLIHLSFNFPNNDFNSWPSFKQCHGSQFKDISWVLHHCTDCRSLKRPTICTVAAYLWSTLHEHSLPAIILLFLGQLSQRGGIDILEKLFLSSTNVLLQFSGNQQGKSPFFLWNAIGFRLPAFGSHVYYLVLMQSDPSPFPSPGPRQGWIPYSRLPHKPLFSHHEYHSSATTLYTVATMAINIMLYFAIQRLWVLTY